MLIGQITPHLQVLMVELGGQMNFSPYLPVGDTCFEIITLWFSGDPAKIETDAAYHFVLGHL